MDRHACLDLVWVFGFPATAGDENIWEENPTATMVSPSEVYSYVTHVNITADGSQTVVLVSRII